jgi:outer membrane protein assembly factor BamB
MIRSPLAALIVASTAASAPALAGDWNQWRGPDRLGALTNCPALAPQWPAGGPKKLWQSEPVPSGGAGGWDSVSVAGGRAYVFVCWKYKAPLTTRTLSTEALRRLGWFPETPAPDLVTAVESARVSGERAGLKGTNLTAWVKKWVAERLPEDQKKHGAFLSDRLNRGDKAVSLDLLAKLAAIKDREFPDAAAFDRWLADNGISGEDGKTVSRSVPVEVQKANDTVVCLDAADGKTLWKTEFPGLPEDRKGCSTPCVEGNRCFVAGTAGTLYCLDAATGKERWRTAVDKAGGINSSPVVVGDAVVALAGVLTAFDAATGQVRWRQEKITGNNSSASAWTLDGKAYVVCNAAGKVTCVNAGDGSIVWTAPGGGDSSIAIRDGHLVVVNGKPDGLVGYAVSAEGAKEAWKAPVKDAYSSPSLCGGYAYATGEGNAVCVELATGRVLWTQKIGAGDCSSPVVADGKLIALGKGAIVMAGVSPEKCEAPVSAKCDLMEYGSPALSGGRLFLRMKNGIACYDLAQ